MFDDGQLEVLKFTEDDNVIAIQLKQHLERDTWRAINAKVDELGGRWVSACEESRWEIPSTI
jgi:hypothetical protein